MLFLDGWFAQRCYIVKEYCSALQVCVSLEAQYFSGYQIATEFDIYISI